MAAPSTVPRLQDSDELWRNNRRLIRDLYQGQDGENHTLAHVRKVLIKDHEFPDLPLARYETRLKDVGLRKKFKKGDWALIWPHWRKLEVEGRTPEVWLCGSRMPQEKAWKEIRRNVPGAQRSSHVRTVLPPLPPGVVVQGEGDAPPASPVIPPMPLPRTRVARRTQTRQLIRARISAPITVSQNTGGQILCNTIATKPGSEVPLWGVPFVTELALSTAPCYPELPIKDLTSGDLSKIFKGMWLRDLPWLQARGQLRSLSRHANPAMQDALVFEALPLVSLLALTNARSISDNYEDIPTQLFRSHDINLQSSRALSVEIDPFHFLELAVFRLSNCLVGLSGFYSREDNFLWTIFFNRLPKIVSSLLAQSTLASFRSAWRSLVDIATLKRDGEALAKIIAAVAEDEVHLRADLIEPLLKMKDSKNLEMVLRTLPGGEHITAARVQRMARWAMNSGDRCGRVLVSWLMTVVCEADYTQALQAGVGVVPEDRVLSYLEECGLPAKILLGLETHACRACGLRQADVWSAMGEQVYHLLVQHEAGGAEQVGLYSDAREHMDILRDGERHHDWDWPCWYGPEDIASELVETDWQTPSTYCTELLGWIASHTEQDHVGVQCLMEAALKIAARCKQEMLGRVLMIVRLLLRHGVQPSASSISRAVTSDALDRTEVLQLLQDEGVDMTALGGLALVRAARYRHPHTTQWLLNAGIDVDTFLERQGAETTLMGMTVDDHLDPDLSDEKRRAALEMVYLLMRNGVAPRLHPSEHTPINLVANLLEHGLYRGCDPSELLQILGPADLASPDAALLTISSVNGKCFHVLEWLLDIGTPHYPGLLAGAMIHKAPKDMVQRILSSTADVNVRGLYRRTALMAACVQIDKDLCIQLVNNGAKVDLADKDSITALHYVCKQSTLTEAGAAEQVAIVQLLLQHGAQVDAGAMTGDTALIHVAENGNVELAIILLDAGADPNSMWQYLPLPVYGGIRWYRALDSAAQNGRLDMVQLLINAGAESGWQFHSLYDGAIALATKRSHTEVTKLLFRHAKYSDVETIKSMYTKYENCKYWPDSIYPDLFKSQYEAALLDWIDVWNTSNDIVSETTPVH